MAKKTTKKKSSALLPYKLAKVGVVVAIFGALLKLTEVTQTFPAPSDLIGNLVIFLAVLIIVADIAKGGLLD